MQHGEFPVTDRDITANLPFVPGVHLAFDHHSSEMVRVRGRTEDRFINDPAAPSCAQVIYDRFGGAAAFPTVRSELMRAVNRADSARFSREDVLEPSGYALLNFLLDGRTGLSRFRMFRASNDELLLQMVEVPCPRCRPPRCCCCPTCRNGCACISSRSSTSVPSCCVARRCTGAWA